MVERLSTGENPPVEAAASRGLVLAAAMMAIVLTATEGSIVANLGGFHLFSWALPRFS